MLKPNELWNLIDTAKYETTGTGLEWTIVEKEDAIYLLFQESTNGLDWKINFDFLPKFYMHQCFPMLIHRGFANSYKKGADEIMNRFIKAVENAPGKEVIISGWSYGGAMSVLAAEDYHYRTGDKAHVINFGAPNIVAPFAIITYLRLKFSMRKYEMYANVNDVVTIVPPFFLTFGRKLVDKVKFGGIFKPNIYHCKYGDPTIY